MRLHGFLCQPENDDVTAYSRTYIIAYTLRILYTCKEHEATRVRDADTQFTHVQFIFIDTARTDVHRGYDVNG